MIQSISRRLAPAAKRHPHSQQQQRHGHHGDAIVLVLLVACSMSEPPLARAWRWTGRRRRGSCTSGRQQSTSAGTTWRWAMPPCWRTHWVARPWALGRSFVRLVGLADTQVLSPYSSTEDNITEWDVVEGLWDHALRCAAQAACNARQSRRASSPAQGSVDSPIGVQTQPRRGAQPHSLGRTAVVHSRWRRPWRAAMSGRSRPGAPPSTGRPV